MDVTLYAIGLVLFAVLYLAIGIFLAFTLLITLVLMFLFLALRWGNVSQNYPHTVADSFITVIFIGVTWGIFVFVGPKNPVPFIGNGLTYATASAIPARDILAVAFVVAVGFLVVFSFAARYIAESHAGTRGAPPSTADSKPKQGVGA